MSDDVEFKVGDVVYLQSGSGRMTVAHPDKNATRVVWTNYGENRPMEMTAPAACFKLQGAR